MQDMRLTERSAVLRFYRSTSCIVAIRLILGVLIRLTALCAQHGAARDSWRPCLCDGLTKVCTSTIQCSSTGACILDFEVLGRQGSRPLNFKYASGMCHRRKREGLEQACHLTAKKHFPQWTRHSERRSHGKHRPRSQSCPREQRYLSPLIYWARNQKCQSQGTWILFGH